MLEEKFCIVGIRPVKSIRTTDGELAIYSLNWETGKFELDMSYLSKIYFGTGDDVEEISESEFNSYVAKLKKEKGL